MRGGEDQAAQGEHCREQQAQNGVGSFCAGG
jgi:hypothetical protein